MRLASLLIVALLSMACRGPGTKVEVPVQDPVQNSSISSGIQGDDATGPDESWQTREADAMLNKGLLFRPPEPGVLGSQLLVPVSVGFTEFSLSDGVSLDQLATVAVVPTLELIAPLSDRWTLLPFVGGGVAYQTGSTELIGDRHLLGLLTGGLRLTRWQHFAQRHWFGFTTQARYDVALTGRNGLLGDWGSVDAAFELRRDFGESHAGPRFQGGFYVQVSRFWDPVELEISGVSPQFVDDWREIGISLGSTSTFKILGITVPRIFIGYFDADGLRGVRIRFGRL